MGTHVGKVGGEEEKSMTNGCMIVDTVEFFFPLEAFDIFTPPPFTHTHTHTHPKKKKTMSNKNNKETKFSKTKLESNNFSLHTLKPVYKK